MDNGFPQQNSSTPARIRMRVTRNQNAPRFDSETYEKSIPETQQTGSSVIDINAQDADPEGPFKTITYSLIGDDAAPNFFEIEPEDGLIKVKRDLRTENVDFYNVSGKPGSLCRRENRQQKKLLPGKKQISFHGQ